MTMRAHYYPPRSAQSPKSGSDISTIEASIDYVQIKKIERKKKKNSCACVLSETEK